MTPYDPFRYKSRARDALIAGAAAWLIFCLICLAAWWITRLIG